MIRHDTTKWQSLSKDLFVTIKLSSVELYRDQSVTGQEEINEINREVIGDLDATNFLERTMKLMEI